MNGYVCIRKNQRVEVYANTTYEAQQMALKHFAKNNRGKVKGYEIAVSLCEKDGETITHKPDF